jgi:hypothetical protein
MKTTLLRISTRGCVKLVKSLGEEVTAELARAV